MKNINFKNQDELIAIVLEINILLLNSHLYIKRELQILFNINIKRLAKKSFLCYYVYR